ncbi:MAG: malate synthase [Flammeovirgaceae bacterium]
MQSSEFFNPQSKMENTTIALEIKGKMNPEFERILSEEAIEFLIQLQHKFNGRRLELLEKRVVRQKEIDGGKMPDFLPETREIREGDWRVAPIPEDLLDRRVEITGPVERKMIINALNSGAYVFMADCEDSSAPTWDNVIQGQINLRDAVDRTIDFTNPKNNKFYQLNDKTATLLVRPRGWHLEEKHLLLDGEVMSGSLVDFGLYFFHNAKKSLEMGTGPYFYLPKLESHLEARLWNDVFVFAQDYVGVPQGTIKATVLVETILASFELNEILYELRNHSAGLNCGRWDYIFSYIKKFSQHSDKVLPNRAEVGMTVPFMKNYSDLVIQVCHNRGIHAMGGMAAQIPIKGDEEANQKAVEKVSNDKKREAMAGHDGTWVAHPGLVLVALEQFNKYMPHANQIGKKREDVNVSAEGLLVPCKGSITKAGLELNIDVAIQYLESWLGGNGCVPIYNLMEDAATAEISRAQVWQWLKHESKLDSGETITKELVEALIPEQLKKIGKLVGTERYANGYYKKATEIFRELVFRDDFVEFLTLPAYQEI